MVEQILFDNDFWNHRKLINPKCHECQRMMRLANIEPFKGHDEYLAVIPLGCSCGASASLEIQIKEQTNDR